jgi:hypothetical protein
LEYTEPTAIEEFEVLFKSIYLTEIFINTTGDKTGKKNFIKLKKTLDSLVGSNPPVINLEQWVG